MKRPERPERRVVEQFGPEQGRPYAVVDPDVRPPPGVCRLARLEGVLVRRGHDRRDVVDAWVMRPRHLHPDAIAGRQPVPVAGRAPPLLWRGNDPGTEVVLPRAALKDPVGPLSLPRRLSDGTGRPLTSHRNCQALRTSARMAIGVGRCEVTYRTFPGITPPALLRYPEAAIRRRAGRRSDTLSDWA